MAGKIVVVGCKLPNGIILQNPLDENHTFELNGLNKISIIGAEHGITEVDGALWEAWEKVNKEFAPLKSGAIFVAATRNDLEAVAKETKGRKTGLEPMKQDSNGVKKAEE